MRKIKKLSTFTLCCLGLIILVACNETDDNGQVGGLSFNEVGHVVEVENQDFQEMEIFIDHPHFELDELSYWSTDVIRGVVLDERVEIRNSTPSKEETRERLINEGLTEEEIEYELSLSSFKPQYNVGTTYRIEVLEVFQGNLSVGEIIEVRRPGGLYHGEYWFIRDQVTVSPGDEFIMFLWENFGDRPYAFISAFQGVYHVPASVIAADEDLLDSDNIELELENVGVLDDIVVTIEDLIQIAEENDLLD